MRPTPTIRELAPAELPSIFPLVHWQNPAISRALFDERLAAMLPLGYRAAGVFLGEEMIGCSGFWIRTRFWSGREFDIDNFIISPDHQGQKLGEQLCQWLEQKALAEQCDLMVLDAYIDNFLAARFYYRQGFVTTGHHFTKVPGSNRPWTKKRD